jgi:nucleoside-diphosphate-sugar epimerase
MKKHDILVTGASGLIGKAVVKSLLRRQRSVLALDLRSDPLFKQLPSDRVTFVQGDCRTPTLVDQLVSRVGAVVHLAAPSSVLMYEEQPGESSLNTVQSFITVVEAMKSHGVNKIVHASTSAVYEGNPLPYRESMSIDPPDLKAQSKKLTELIADRYSAKYGITSIAMRPFSVYGDDESHKGQRANILSLFAWAMVAKSPPVVWSDGEQTRDFIHADDVAEAFCLALESSIGSQPINVGTGIETTFNQAIAMINKLTRQDLQAEYRTAPISIYARRLLSDNSVARRELNFKPGIPLEKGIRRLVDTAKHLVRERSRLGVEQHYFPVPDAVAGSSIQRHELDGDAGRQLAGVGSGQPGQGADSGPV